jgi:hypothetical protein
MISSKSKQATGKQMDVIQVSADRLLANKWMLYRFLQTGYWQTNGCYTGFCRQATGKQMDVCYTGFCRQATGKQMDVIQVSADRLLANKWMLYKFLLFHLIRNLAKFYGRYGDLAC